MGVFLTHRTLVPRASDARVASVASMEALYLGFSTEHRDLRVRSLSRIVCRPDAWQASPVSADVR